jgi:hypothetical protein
VERIALGSCTGAREVQRIDGDREVMSDLDARRIHADRCTA